MTLRPAQGGQRFAPGRATTPVKPAPPSVSTPRTLCRFSRTDPIVIQLTCKDPRWNQYAYQFAHEFCHLLSGYEDLEGNPNNWFHETICELASVFTLRRMGEQWATHPPYANWTDYSKSLLKYAAQRQKRDEVQLPIGLIFPIGCRLTNLAYVKTDIKETRTLWWHTLFCQFSRNYLLDGTASANSRVPRESSNVTCLTGLRLLIRMTCHSWSVWRICSDIPLALIQKPGDPRPTFGARSDQHH